MHLGLQLFYLLFTEASSELASMEGLLSRKQGRGTGRYSELPNSWTKNQWQQVLQRDESR